MLNIVESIIEAEYRKIVKEFKDKTDPTWRQSVCMELSFRLKLNYDQEDGYRNLKILLVSSGGYVDVLAKTTWTVIKNEWLEDEEDGGIKPGFDYIKGETPWVHFCSHDSCWGHDGLGSILRAFRDRITMIDSNYTRWYESKVISHEEYEQLQVSVVGNKGGELPREDLLKSLDHKW